MNDSTAVTTGIACQNVVQTVQFVDLNDKFKKSGVIPPNNILERKFGSILVLDNTSVNPLHVL